MANHHNHAIYNHPRSGRYLRKLAAERQFGTRDVELALPFVQQARTVLEVGPGYGRVLDALLETVPDAVLTGLEYSATLAAALQRRYAGRAEIIHADALVVELTARYDAVLLLWSILNDCSYVEQQQLIARTAGWLAPGGCVVIDIPDAGARSYADLSEAERSTRFATPLGTLHGYDPGDTDIAHYAHSAGLIVTHTLRYATRGGYARVLYVLGWGEIQRMAHSSPVL